ncbi:MAG TPA: VWA domain-containing protein [Pyrinomonadaceae bacterium]|nr:VWA domain-containing protein [Pyrinomonadaceae bacterium]
MRDENENIGVITADRFNLRKLFSISRFSSLILLTFLFLFLFHTTIHAQDDDEVISVESSIVILNATITDANGKPVLGLKQNQFRVLEDGIEQKVDFFEAEKTPFAAVILIDTSGSMEGSVSIARAAAINFLDGLRVDDMTAIYNFDSKVSLVQDFSNSRDIVEKIFNLKASGMTALNDAIYQAAVELGKRNEKRRAIIVLSDGADTKSGRSADKALKAAIAANATIYTIDMAVLNTNSQGRFQNQKALKNFAEKSGGKFIPTPGGVAMREAFKNIVAELGVQYTLGYQPTNTKKDGKWRAIEIRVARPNLQIRTRKGYNAVKERK